MVGRTERAGLHVPERLFHLLEGRLERGRGHGWLEIFRGGGFGGIRQAHVRLVRADGRKGAPAGADGRRAGEGGQAGLRGRDARAGATTRLRGEEGGGGTSQVAGERRHEGVIGIGADQRCGALRIGMSVVGKIDITGGAFGLQFILAQVGRAGMHGSRRDRRYSIGRFRPRLGLRVPCPVGFRGGGAFARFGSQQLIFLLEFFQPHGAVHFGVTFMASDRGGKKTGLVSDDIVAQREPLPLMISRPVGQRPFDVRKLAFGALDR